MSLTKNTFEALSIFARVQNFLAHNNLEMFFGQCFLSNVDSKYYVLLSQKQLVLAKFVVQDVSCFFLQGNCIHA